LSELLAEGVEVLQPLLLLVLLHAGEMRGEALVTGVHARLEISEAHADSLEQFNGAWLLLRIHLLLLKAEEWGEGVVRRDGVAESCEQAWCPLSLRMHSQCRKHHYLFILQ